MRLPGFLVIGAQRAGTTWLYKNLREHPDVFMPARKELEFFAHDAEYDKGVDHYAAYFTDASSESIVGEATPSYLWVGSNGSRWEQFPPARSREIHCRVREVLGSDIKLFVSLRDPIHRAASAFVMHAQYGRVDLDDGIVSVGKQAGIVHMGFYALHLRPWLDLFGDQILVLFQELTERDLAGTLRRVYRHAGVDPRHRAPRTTERSNRGPVVDWRDDGAWVIRESVPDVRIATAHDLDMLREEYAPDVEALGALLGLDMGTIWPDFW